MTNIKTIFFDWGGVLIDNPANDLIAYCSNKLDVSPEILSKSLEQYLNKFQTDSISEEMFWDKLCAKLNVPIPNIDSLWGEAFRAVYSPKKNMLNVVSNLKFNGFVTTILSNTEMPAYNYFEELNYDLFDYAIFSCIEKVRKPDLKIFQIALNKSNTKEFEGIFIDDKMENISAAQELGINTIYFQNTFETIEKLKLFSIYLPFNKI